MGETAPSAASCSGEVSQLNARCLACPRSTVGMAHGERNIACASLISSSPSSRAPNPSSRISFALRADLLARVQWSQRADDDAVLEAQAFLDHDHIAVQAARLDVAPLHNVLIANHPHKVTP